MFDDDAASRFFLIFAKRPWVHRTYRTQYPEWVLGTQSGYWVPLGTQSGYGYPEWVCRTFQKQRRETSLFLPVVFLYLYYRMLIQFTTLNLISFTINIFYIQYFKCNRHFMWTNTFEAEMDDLSS